jgi:hypothetical protein
MLKIFSRLFGKRAPTPVQCSPIDQRGEHGQLIGGLGGMGDAILCLRCGLERYEEHWPAAYRLRADYNWYPDRKEEVWAQIKVARQLPGGIITQAGTGHLYQQAAELEKQLNDR